VTSVPDISFGDNEEDVRTREAAVDPDAVANPGVMNDACSGRYCPPEDIPAAAAPDVNYDPFALGGQANTQTLDAEKAAREAADDLYQEQLRRQADQYVTYQEDRAQQAVAETKNAMEDAQRKLEETKEANNNLFSGIGNFFSGSDPIKAAEEDLARKTALYQETIQNLEERRATANSGQSKQETVNPAVGKVPDQIMQAQIEAYKEYDPIRQEKEEGEIQSVLSTAKATLRRDYLNETEEALLRTYVENHSAQEAEELLKTLEDQPSATQRLTLFQAAKGIPSELADQFQMTAEDLKRVEQKEVEIAQSRSAGLEYSKASVIPELTGIDGYVYSGQTSVAPELSSALERLAARRALDINLYVGDQVPSKGELSTELERVAAEKAAQLEADAYREYYETLEVAAEINKRSDPILAQAQQDAIKAREALTMRKDEDQTLPTKNAFERFADAFKQGSQDLSNQVINTVGEFLGWNPPKETEVALQTDEEIDTYKEYFESTKKAAQVVVSTQQNLEFAKEEAALLRQNTPLVQVVPEITKTYEADRKLAELNDAQKREYNLALQNDAANYVDGIMRAAELNAQRSKDAALAGNFGATQYYADLALIGMGTGANIIEEYDGQPIIDNTVVDTVTRDLMAASGQAPDVFNIYNLTRVSAAVSGLGPELSQNDVKAMAMLLAGELPSETVRAIADGTITEKELAEAMPIINVAINRYTANTGVIVASGGDGFATLEEVVYANAVKPNGVRVYQFSAMDPHYIGTTEQNYNLNPAAFDAFVEKAFDGTLTDEFGLAQTAPCQSCDSYGNLPVIQAQNGGLPSFAQGVKKLTTDGGHTFFDLTPGFNEYAYVGPAVIGNGYDEVYARAVATLNSEEFDEVYSAGPSIQLARMTPSEGEDVFPEAPVPLPRIVRTEDNDVAPVPAPRINRTEISSVALLSENQVKGTFMQEGITTWESKPGATELENFRAGTIAEIVDLKKACDCKITITGGTERQTGDTGIFSHKDGYKFDARIIDPETGKRNELATYVTENLEYIGTHADGARIYLDPNKPNVTYALKSNVLDVTVMPSPTNETIELESSEDSEGTDEASSRTRNSFISDTIHKANALLVKFMSR
jgi:hypothetical protein